MDKAPPKGITKKLDTRESRAFWNLAAKTSAEVATWPAWKRADYAPRPERTGSDG